MIRDLLFSFAKLVYPYDGDGGGLLKQDAHAKIIRRTQRMDKRKQARRNQPGEDVRGRGRTLFGARKSTFGRMKNECNLGRRTRYERAGISQWLEPVFVGGSRGTRREPAEASTTAAGGILATVAARKTRRYPAIGTLLGDG